MSDLGGPDRRAAMAFGDRTLVLAEWHRKPNRSAVGHRGSCSRRKPGSSCGAQCSLSKSRFSWRFGEHYAVIKAAVGVTFALDLHKARANSKVLGSLWEFRIGCATPLRVRNGISARASWPYGPSTFRWSCEFNPVNLSLGPDRNIRDPFIVLFPVNKVRCLDRHTDGSRDHYSRGR